MPLAFLAPDDLDRAGVAQPSIRLTNPLAAEESVLRPSLRPGPAQGHPLQPVAPPARRRPCSRSARPSGCPRGTGPARRARGAGSRGSDADVSAAVEAWTVLRAEPRRGRSDPRAGVGGRPASGPLGPPAGRRRRSSARSGRSIPAVLDTLGIVGRVAWLEVDLDALLDQPHGVEAYAPVSRYPSSDIDLAFVVSEDVAAGAVRSSIVEAGAPAVPRRAPVRRVPQRHPAVRADAAWPSPCASRLTTAPSPTTRWPRSAPR